ncbi:MAG: hypothetical protein MN733_00960, partial [Nitrososphaera sp.]|nr:hypothetical protein [Nitrososphaera sp.]
EQRTGKGRDAAIAAGAIRSISKAITEHRNRKEQGEIAKAQNWYNVFQTALAQGDMWTTNLYASDPKILQAWEKWLKLDLKRVPGTAVGQATVPGGVNVANLSGPGVSARPGMIQTLPTPTGVPGDINMPGGIAIPRAGGEEQLAAVRRNFLTQIAQQDPEKFIAMTTPRGELAAISGEEFRQAAKSQLGLELTPLQTQQLSQRTKLAMMDLRVDLFKFVTGEGTKLDIAETEKMSRENVAKIGAVARVQAMRERMSGIQKLNQEKTNTLEGKMLLNAQGAYEEMMKQFNKEKASLLAEGYKPDHKRVVALDEKIVEYQKKATAIRNEYEGWKLYRKFLGDEPEVEQEVEPEVPQL